LVHGYTGSPEDLASLARVLGRRWGKDAVCNLRLSGHADDTMPAFESQAYENAIAEAVASHRRRGRRIILVGHSTGGCLALGYLRSSKALPDLLVLAGTPAAVNGSDLTRWEKHRQHLPAVPLGDVACMVTYINRVGLSPPPGAFPVLVLHGACDDLVSPAGTSRWRDGRCCGPVRKVIIPRTGHDLFIGPGSRIALDCIDRAISDAVLRPEPATSQAAASIGAMETRAAEFMATGCSRAHHLTNSPAAARALGRSLRCTAVIETDPFQLNVEITSRCNLGCAHCAREHHQRCTKDMEITAFEYLLDLLPNTFTVVLVGLGEPTLHPQAAEFVACAARRGHRVGMVTNAMALDEGLSRRLIAAGLGGVTFSLDSVDAETVAQVRAGTDLDRVLSNIGGFLKSAKGTIPTAVFTAVSTRNVHSLPELADAVAGLGVDAWMLSDMNFASNLSIALAKHWRPSFGTAIGRAIQLAFSRRLPVLSVRALEALGLQSHYHDYLITTPAGLGHRSEDHHWCLSPWQTLPVDVDGNVTLCDCQPRAFLGNLFEDALGDIWNGEALQAHRRAMRSATPPEACRICPRF